MPFDYKTASAIAGYEVIHTDKLRDFAYAARQTWDELQLSKRENSSLQREIKNLQGEIDVLKSSLLEIEATPQSVVPEGYRVERGSVTYNEILVTAPDGGQQTFWFDDAAYELIKALLTAGKGGEQQ
jgi:hypothetical protein